MKTILLKLIVLYQKTISPDHGLFFKNKYPYGCCCFYPSCSEYAKMALKKYGLGKALWCIIKRVSRCRPGAQAGVDLP